MLPRDAAPTTRSPRLDDVIADVRLALRWRREHSSGVLPRAARSPLARLQGEASGADRDATAAKTAGLWRLVTTPSSKVGRRARAAFVAALVEHCGEGPREDGADVDWALARALARALAALEAPRRRALVAVADDGGAVAWERAALLVADACAPPALRASWTGVRRAAGGGEGGRPRVDRLAPPPGAEALAWGERELRAAVDAWAAAGSAGPTGA